MSGRLVSQVYERELGHAEQAILVAMADHADDFGRGCRPSMAYVAWKTGYNDRQVRRIVHALRAAGALVTVREATPRRPAEYAINLAALPEKKPFRDDDGPIVVGVPAVMVARPGLTQRPPQGGRIDPLRGDTAMSYEPSRTVNEPEPEAVANNATAGDANDASPGAAPGRIADVIEVALGQTFAPAAEVVALVDGIEADKAKRRKPRPPNPWTETNEAYRLTFGLPAVASTWKLASLVVAVLREHGVAPADGPATWARFVAAMERAEKWHFVQAHNAGQWLAKWMVGAKAGRTGMVMKLGGVS